MIEIEKEIKFTINTFFLQNLYLDTLTNNTQLETKSVGEHLIVYYDYGRVLRDRGDTFRLTYRKDRNRGTYKVTEGKEGVMRVCTKYHFPFTKEVNPFRKRIEIYSEDIKHMLPYPHMERTCWVRVTRTKALLDGMPVEIDECKIPLLNGGYKKEAYYEVEIDECKIPLLNGGYKKSTYYEVEIEDTVPSTEWIDKMKTLGMFEESLKNKYQTVYDIVYG